MAEKKKKALEREELAFEDSPRLKKIEALKRAGDSGKLLSMAAHDMKYHHRVLKMAKLCSCEKMRAEKLKMADNLKTLSEAARDAARCC